MSDGRLVVNFNALQAATADIDSAISTIDAKLSEVEQAAKPLVDTWGGTAKNAYAERQETWRRAAEELKEILRRIKGAVDDSALDYADTEKRATSLFT